MASRRGQRYEIPTSETPPAPGYANGSAAPGSSVGPDALFGSKLISGATAWTHSIDEKLGELGHPLKPHLPLVGRLLVVSTFLEDTIRMFTDWNDQIYYLWNSRGLPWIVALFFCLLNISMMLGGSYCTLAKKHLKFGVGALVADIILQSVIYGVDFTFFCRNFSLTGGLLLIVSDIFVQDTRASSMIPGLLRVDKDSMKDPRQRLILGGRILVVFQFITHIITARWTLGNSAMNVLSSIAVFLVVIGYKARFSASLLAILLLVQNVTSNSYWNLSHANPARDVVRYHFFQTLSIVGGLIMLVNMGAGRISIDEKRKIY